MILPDWMIRKLCLGVVPATIPFGLRRTNYNITPMVTPYDPELVNPASLDIRVGNTAKLRTIGGYLNIDLTQYSEEKPYLIYPKDRVLVDSLENFNIPIFLCAQFTLKSSRCRQWYEQMQSGFGWPGWSGKLTMELINMDLEPLPIYTGLRMGQFVFSLMLAIPEKDYSLTGRYNNDLTVMESKD